MSVLLSRQPTIFSKTEPPTEKYFLFHENPNSKKKFRINIITIISKPSIKSSVNGFRQISYETGKKFLMSPLNSNKLKKFHFTKSQNNIAITVQKCSVFFSSFFNLCTDYLKKCSFFLSFFLYAVFNNVQVRFFLCHFHCPVAFCFCFGFHFLNFFFIINCSFTVPFFPTFYLPLSVHTLIL